MSDSWRLGVVGSPILHSLSPQLHAAGLRLTGLTGESTAIELDVDHADALRGLLGEHFDALSVTMPLKAVAVDIADVVDEVARGAHSANSLVWRNKRVHAASTDGAGFIDALDNEWGLDVDNMHVVVLGAGGAARSIVDALVVAGVNSIALHGRTQSKVEAIIRRHPNVVDHMIIYRPVDLVINTTPVEGRQNYAAVMQGITPDTFAVDITYQPRESAWLALYRAHGCAAMNGLSMLAAQAARQMNWWWGTDLSGVDLLKDIA